MRDGAGVLTERGFLNESQAAGGRRKVVTHASGLLHHTLPGESMPPYTRIRGRDFWYRLDNETLWQRTPQVNAALAAAYFNHGLTFDSVMDALRMSAAGTNHPGDFVNIVQVGQQGFLDLAAIQLNIMMAELGDNASIQSAFEDFGQGVLYDNRPPRMTGRLIHMMDGTRDTWVGYHRWHAFARAAGLLGADAAQWLHIDRCIALAWAIQTEANPPIDAQNNPDLPAARLAELRTAWMGLSSEQLDRAFATNDFRAPSATAILGTTAAVTYAQVQALLGAAAGVSFPMHMGHGRFWEKSYVDFMAIPHVYGHPLIAPPGPNRGQNSAMVKALRGTLAGTLRMPLNRPPMAAADIQLIESWIDAGCPEH